MKNESGLLGTMDGLAKFLVTYNRSNNEISMMCMPVDYAFTLTHNRLETKTFYVPKADAPLYMGIHVENLFGVDPEKVVYSLGYIATPEELSYFIEDLKYNLDLDHESMADDM